jgi:hypothetical protein
MGWKFRSESIVLHVLNKTEEVSYANICAIAKPSYIFRSSGIFRMLLRRAWQTAYNRIIRVQYITVRFLTRITESAVKKNHAGGGFSVSVMRMSATFRY